MDPDIRSSARMDRSACATRDSANCLAASTHTIKLAGIKLIPSDMMNASVSNPTSEASGSRAVLESNDVIVLHPIWDRT
ncbi:hypothetical protein Hanom_Chr06g00524101 [Helianthus anomalus]